MEVQIRPLGDLKNLSENLKDRRVLAHYSEEYPIGLRWQPRMLYYTTDARAEQESRLRQTSDLLNVLEVTVTALAAELSQVQELMRSLREDLHNFSTFEQICNSGMLRNFKIDSESEFAQTILSLLQRTMELQIHHLEVRQKPPE